VTPVGNAGGSEACPTCCIPVTCSLPPTKELLPGWGHSSSKCEALSSVPSTAPPKSAGFSHYGPWRFRVPFPNPVRLCARRMWQASCWLAQDQRLGPQPSLTTALALGPDSNCYKTSNCLTDRTSRTHGHFALNVSLN
jgi:hypothetical protein